MTKTPRDIRPAGFLRALQKAGFVIDRQTGSHARLKHPDGRATTIALHPKPIFHGTLRKMLRDVDLSPEELKRLMK